MTVDLILDCQFGSTGKGLFASYLAEQHSPDVIAYAPSPNAGHTFVHSGKTVVHKILPSGVTSPGLKAIVLGPGSLIDLDKLGEEFMALAELDVNCPSVYVHQNAAVVLPRHREAESNGGTAPGSTRQGVGAAQIERIQRRPDSSNTVASYSNHPVFQAFHIVNTQEMQQLYFNAHHLHVESCQGYSLSLFHGQYPYVTSRDVTTASILADTGVPFMRRMRVYGTFRTYPIRVANRPDDGEFSGATYPDSKEINFADIEQPQETTTVTKLPRRLFTWSQQQALEACAQNRVDVGFLNFCQYPPTFEELVHIWESLTDVQFMGFGPRSEDVFKVGHPSISVPKLRDIYEGYRSAARSGQVGQPGHPEPHSQLDHSEAA